MNFGRNGHFQAHCLTFISAIFVVIFECSSVSSLKCKCTQSSPKTPCQDGVCEAPSGSSACLMLDHPKSGRHYACSTAKLQEGECIDKVTKSGTRVNICPCDSSDYCNYKLWPLPSEDFENDDDHDYVNSDVNQRVNQRDVNSENLREANSALSSHKSIATMILFAQFSIILFFMF